VSQTFIFDPEKNHEHMQRPYIICHMGATIDGKIISANWGAPELAAQFGELYNQCHEAYNSQGWILGRVSLEQDFSKGIKPDLVPAPQPVSRKPFIGDKEASTFAVTFDTKGKLGWNSNEIGGDHIIAVLTEDVSDAYLYYLQRKGISYLFAGKEQPDLHIAMAQLTSLFNIQKIMLEGGGHLNGAFLNERLIDEISLLLLPIADGTPKAATVFEVTNVLKKAPAASLRLSEITRLDNDVIWLKYHL
jgi:riboflavin biosynthesis pyrimidine reductase